MRRILASALAGLVLCGVPHTTPAQTAPAAACSTAPASAPSWGLRPLPVGVRAIAPGDTLPLSVSICNPMPVERVTAAPVELIEQATKRKFADGRVALCPTSSPCNGEPFRLEGSGGHRVWLVTQSNATPLPGKYDGAVTVFSADKPGGESVSLTVHVTSWEWQVFGFLLILAGIAAAWYVTSFMRQRLAREQLLLPAVVLRADIDKLAHTLGALPRAFATPEIDAKLAAVNELLSDEALERQGLPPRIPLPWQGPNASINADAFRKHIEAQAAWISALQRIVDDGVVKLVGLRRGATASGGPLTDLQQQAFAEALGRLDQLVLATEAPAPADLAGRIETQLDAFKASLAAQVGVMGVGLLPDSSDSSAGTRSPQALRLRIALGGLFAWGFIGSVTALTGAYILILTNSGFGTPLDLLGCLLWGLGLPAGTMLASATTGSIATTFNVTR